MLHLPTVGKGHSHDVSQSGKRKIFDSSWCSGSHVTSFWERCSPTSPCIDLLNVPLADPKSIDALMLHARKESYGVASPVADMPVRTVSISLQNLWPTLIRQLAMNLII